MSQAIRGIFLFFQGSSQGGTLPDPPIPVFTTQDRIPCSSMIGCAGLSRKTVEIAGNAADFGAGVIIEGTVSETANDKANWFPLTNAITNPGLFTIEIGAAAPSALFYEPEITFIRIRAITAELGAIMPKSISATMAAFWDGECSWDKRLKSDGLGWPQRNPDYKAV